MKTRYGVSPWILDFPDSRRPALPKFRGDLQCDVAIIGGGLTGLLAAYASAAAGLSTVLLEANRIGHGGSGYGAGLLLPEPGPSFKTLSSAHGLRAARHVFTSWHRASLDAAALLRTLKIPSALEPLDTALLSDDERTLRREFDARAGAGVDGKWVDAKPAAALTRQSIAGVIRSSGAFAVDPYRVVVGVAGAARKQKAKLFERSPVRKSTFTRDGVLVELAGGTLRARTAIIATGTMTELFAPLQRHVTVQESYLVLTDVVPPAIRRALPPPMLTLADTRQPHPRLRWTADHRLLIGGAAQAGAPSASTPAVLVQRTGQLMYELLTRYPEISGLRPAFGWAAPWGETADGLPYIGAHRNYPHHLFALGGGDSMTGAFLAATLLTRALTGKPDKADTAFGWTR